MSVKINYFENGFTITNGDKTICGGTDKSQASEILRKIQENLETSGVDSNIIRNVQRGTINATVSGSGNYVLTISPVDMDKSILLYNDALRLSYYDIASKDNDNRMGFAKLTSSTTIEFTTNYYRESSYDDNTACYEWQLIEFR